MKSKKMTFSSIIYQNNTKLWVVEYFVEGEQFAYSRYCDTEAEALEFKYDMINEID